jgi:hypothetical protein
MARSEIRCGPEMTSYAGEFVEFTSKGGPLHLAAAPVLDGVCGLRGACLENCGRSGQISDPKFVDGTVHVGCTERYVLEAAL